MGSNIKFMTYGAPGTGKTRLAGSSSWPTLIIRPPMDHTDSLAVISSAAEEWVIDSWAEMEEAYEYLKHEGEKAYRWTVLDSISLWQDSGLDDVFADTVARKGPERAEFGPDKGEYGINMHRLAKWVRHVCALDMNIMITAHPFQSEDDEGDMLMMPYIQGKQMPEKISGYMNLIGYLKVHESEKHGTTRVLLTDRAGKWYGKDQFDAFGGKLIDPTLDKIEEAIQKAKDNVKRTVKKATKRTVKKATATKTDVAWDDV